MYNVGWSYDSVGTVKPVELVYGKGHKKYYPEHLEASGNIQRNLCDI